MANTSTPYPLINGVRHSWASLEIRVDGDIVLGLTSLNFKSKLDPATVYGAGVRPIAFTVGRAEHEGDFEILLEEFNTLIAKLGDSFMSKQFDIVASYDESNSGLSTIVDTLVGCRITDLDRSNTSANADPTIVKCTIKMLDVLYDGNTAVPQQPTVA